MSTVIIPKQIPKEIRGVVTIPEKNPGTVIIPNVIIPENYPGTVIIPEKQRNNPRK
jgi:hypothetical protein